MGVLEATSKLMKATRPRIAELEENRQAILARLSEIDGELKRARKVERPAAMQNGNSEEIAAIADRIEALEVEEKALLARRGPIHRLIQAERVQAYSKDARQKKQALMDSAQRVRDLRRQVAQAEEDLKSAVDTHGRMIKDAAAAGQNAEALTLDRSTAEDIGNALVGDHPRRENVNVKQHAIQTLMRGA